MSNDEIEMQEIFTEPIGKLLGFAINNYIRKEPELFMKLYLDGKYYMITINVTDVEEEIDIKEMKEQIKKSLN